MQFIQKDAAQPVYCPEVVAAMTEKSKLWIKLSILYQLDFRKFRQ